MLTKIKIILFFLLFLPVNSFATYIGLYSFETETMFQYSINTCTLSTNPAKTNSSLKCAYNSGVKTLELILRPTNASVETRGSYGGISACFDFYLDAGGFNQDIMEFGDSTGAYAGHLSVTSANKLRFCNVSSCATNQEMASAISTDTWYRACIDYQIASDTFKLWLNKEVDASPDINSTLAVSGTTIGDITFKSGGFAGLDNYFDNLVVNDTGFTGQAELAADMYNAWTYRLTLDQDGTAICTSYTTPRTTSSATQTNCIACTSADGYKCVNYTCTEPGDDANYINFTNSAGLYEGYTISNAGVFLTDPENIYAISATAREKGSGGTAGQVRMKFGTGSGSTCNDSSAMTENTSTYENFTYMVEAGSQFDTLTELDNLVLGLDKTNSNNNQRFETLSVEFASSDPVSAGFGNSGGIIWISKHTKEPYKTFSFLKRLFKFPTAYTFLWDKYGVS